MFNSKKNFLHIHLFVWMMLFNYCPIWAVSTVQNGNWNNPATWGGTVPVSNADIVIAHQILMNQNVTVNLLTIQGGASLNVLDFNLTVNGNVEILGTFLDTQVGGSNIFNADLTIQAGGSFNPTANSGFTFKGNIVNQGTFNKSGTGLAFFEGTNLSIKAFEPIQMAGNVQLNANLHLLNGNSSQDLVSFSGSFLTIASGFTLTNQNTFGLQINGDLNGQGTFINDTNALLIYFGANAPMLSGVLQVNAVGNIFKYARNIADNQAIRGTTYFDLHTEGISNKVLAGNIVLLGDLLNKSTLDCSNNQYQISIAGDWTNESTFLARQGTVIFNGNTAQQINHTANNENFYTLNINKASEKIYLNTFITITFRLILNKGIIQTQTFGLIIANNATSDLGTSLSYVEGEMQKTGNQDFIFPLGKNGRLAQIGILNLSNSATIKANYFDIAHPQANISATPLRHISELEYWTLENNNNTTAKIALYWNDASSGITDLADLQIATLGTNVWTNLGGSISNGSTTQIGNIITANSHTLNSVFSFASLNGANQLGNIEPPAPKLLSVKAIASNQIDLLWQDNATNESGFIIQRSENNTQNFNVIKTLLANSTFFSDSTVLPDITYFYRIIATNENGNSLPSEVLGALTSLVSSLETNDLQNVQIFPNPTVAIVFIGIDSEKNLTGTFQLIDFLGKIRLEKSFTKYNEIYLDAIDLQNYASGIYFIKISTANQKFTRKIIKY